MADSPALTENSFLDRDAQMKVADMFSKQYFEHVSPTGVGPGDLAKAVGYQYVLVEKILHWGILVLIKRLTAWMNSPDTVKIFEYALYRNRRCGRKGYVRRADDLACGAEFWYASFCLSRNICCLKNQIDANNTEIARLRAALDAKKAQVDATPTSDPNYNTYANEFNALVPQYNMIIEMNRTLVANYNTSVQVFNDCINVAGTAVAH